MAINYNTVGLRIRRYRMERKITQEELAFRVNTSASYISNIEHGHKKPSLEKLAEIADVLNVTINDLIYPVSNVSSVSSAEKINELISLYTPEQQKKLWDSIGAIIETSIS